MVRAVFFSFILPWLIGTFLVARWSTIEERVTRASAGLVVGLATYVTLAFLCTSLMSLSNVFLPAGALLLALALVFRHSKPQRESPYTDTTLLMLAILVFVVVTPLALRVLIVEEGHLLATGHLNCFGDLPLHIGIIQSFVQGQSFPPESPIYAGQVLIYPFLSDFYSALLVSGGASLRFSLMLPLIALVPAAVSLLYALTKTLTDSRGAAVIAALLFLLSGSVFGFLRLEEFFDGSILSWEIFVRGDPSYYSGSAGDTDNYFLPNPLLAYFIPQRSFLFGFPLSLLIIRLFLSAKEHRETIFAGFLAGLLPLFHPHSILALIIPLLAFSVQRCIAGDFKKTLIFYLAALPVGLIEIAYYFFFSELSNHIHLNVGWLSGEENTLLFWLRNSGLLLPLTLFALLACKKLEKAKLFAASGVVIFLLCNLFFFARWGWDNTKLFVYAFVFFLPLLSTVIASWCRSSIFKPLAVIFVLMHTLSSAVDIVRYSMPEGRQYTLWDKRAITAAKKIQELTEPGETILAAPIHNSIPTLAGRPMYLGFPGMVWTHGGNYHERERALAQFYEGRTRNLFGVSPKYLMYGPVERHRYKNFFADPSWQMLFDHNQVALYKISLE